jgi:hypothetical protein
VPALLLQKSLLLTHLQLVLLTKQRLAATMGCLCRLLMQLLLGQLRRVNHCLLLLLLLLLLLTCRIQP